MDTVNKNLQAASNTVKDGLNYASESVQGAGAGASKEANKNVAKDSHVAAGDRLNAAGSAVSDKFDQTSHNTKADVHKESAKH
ncbi:MAG: hypothetical protein M1825_004367 [Sarcosagium campestre]|nr:MAG: hypothetical protein M1825_004367 [Sarcosagium campestre]